MRSLPLAGLLAFVSVLAIGPAGCGNDSDDEPADAAASVAAGVHASPTTVTQALVAAMDARDAETLRALFPPEAALRRAVDCPNGHGLVADVQAEREALVRALRRLEGVRSAWRGLDEGSGETEELLAGTRERGCRVRRAMVIRKVRLKLELTRDGEADEREEDVKLLRLGESGPWYLMDV